MKIAKCSSCAGRINSFHGGMFSAPFFSPVLLCSLQLSSINIPAITERHESVARLIFWPFSCGTRIIPGRRWRGAKNCFFRDSYIHGHAHEAVKREKKHCHLPRETTSVVANENALPTPHQRWCVLSHGRYHILFTMSLHSAMPKPAKLL